MLNITRRAAVGTLAAAPFIVPGIIRAQSTSKPVRIGLLSDMGGPYRDVGGPGNRLAVELAVEDFGGSVLGRPIEVLQGDDQNKPDVASSLAREWIDNQGVDVLADGAASSSGLAIQQVCREKKRIYLITGPASSDMTGKQCSPYGIHFAYDTYALSHGTGTALTKAGGDTWFFITADYAFGYALERDTIAAVQAAGGKVLVQYRRRWVLRISRVTWCRRRHRVPRCSASPTQAPTCRTASSRPPSSACRRAARAWPRC